MLIMIKKKKQSKYHLEIVEIRLKCHTSQRPVSKKGVSKRAVSLMNLITNLKISWLELLEVADREPYNKKTNFFFNF